MTFIKICGITSVEDAIAAVTSGANMLGFVFADSPRRVRTGTVKHIQRVLAGDVKTVGVFTEESDEAQRIVDECGLTYAQLHGGQSEHFARRLGASRVIRVARVADESSIDALARHTEAAYYLLDTYRKDQAGGTGETFDWSLAVRAKPLGKPIILSGGLTPENVAEAVRAVEPFAVDVSSGVEASPGVKDHLKIKEFIDNVRKANSTA
jgi:phosphoribosylanthranilate isomerase